jgi:hypothetical protein
MAHFAEIQNGRVIQVIAVSNDEVPDEATGLAFIASIGLAGEWVQTSYHGNPIDGQDRGPYAGIGYTWNGATFAPPIAETPEEEVNA